MAVFPLRLKTEKGQRRLDLLARLAQNGRFAISELDSPVDRADVRWAWDKDLLTVVDANPLLFEVTEYGRQIAQRGRELLDDERRQVA